MFMFPLQNLARKKLTFSLNGVRGDGGQGMVGVEVWAILCNFI